MVQKCGSARGISTAPNCTACFSSRQSVAIMLVAVGMPVAWRNSAMISAAGVAILRAARVFRIRQHMLLAAAKSHRFF